MSTSNDFRDKPVRYVICVDGDLVDRWHHWFPNMSIRRIEEQAGSQCTVLDGYVRDQADLRGIVNKIWDLNITLISINRTSATIVRGGYENE